MYDNTLSLLEGVCLRHVLAHMQAFLSRTAALTLLLVLSHASAARLVFMVSLQVMLHSVSTIKANC